MDEIKREDITVLIQGPCNRASINNIENYLNFGKVLVCHWSGEEDDAISKHRSISQFNSVKEDPPLEHYMGTFGHQVSGVYLGLKNITTKYVIRTRSDEYFTDLQPLIDIFQKNDKKLVCGNVFWRKDTHAYKHIGDHLFMGRTALIKKTYHYLKIKTDAKDIQSNGNPEVALYEAHVSNFRHSFSGQPQSLILDVFDVVNMTLLGDYRISYVHCVHGGPRIWDKDNPFNISSYNLIESSSDLAGKSL